MTGLPARTQGIIAAGLMAILTLLVFVNSAYSGPESTAYRLHNALIQRDAQGVQETCLQELDSPSVQNLLGQILTLLMSGADVRIGKVHHQGRDALVEVVYLSKQYGPVGIRFYMHKPRDRWLLDADRTWSLAMQAPMFSR